MKARRETCIQFWVFVLCPYEVPLPHGENSGGREGKGVLVVVVGGQHDLMENGLLHPDNVYAW